LLAFSALALNLDGKLLLADFRTEDVYKYVKSSSYLNKFAD